MSGAMAMGIIGDILGAGTNLIMGNKQVDAQKKVNASNIAYQKEFAQHGISWRVKDAIDAGLHPLAALGAQVTSFTPSSVAPDYSYIGKMGQNLRDLTKHFDAATRQRQQIEDMKAQAELTHMELVNAGLRKDLDGGSPETVTNGMVDPSKVLVQPSQPTVMGNPGIAAGIYPMMKYTQAPGGWIFPTPQQDIQELLTEGINPTMARYLKDWVKDRALDMQHMRDPWTIEGYDYRNFLKELRPTTYADGTPLRKGDEYRYKTNQGFKLFRNVKKSQFYVEDIGIPNSNPVTSAVDKKLKSGHSLSKAVKESNKRTGGSNFYWKRR